MLASTHLVVTAGCDLRNTATMTAVTSGASQASWIDVRDIADTLALITCLAWLCDLLELLEKEERLSQDIFIFVGAVQAVLCYSAKAFACFEL